MARVLAVGTAVPEFRYEQKALRARCAAAFAGTEADGREGLFDRAGVETRALVEAPDYYFAGVPFAKRNADYFPHAERLARRALLSALEQAGVGISELTHLFSVTTTGLLTPSLDAHLAQSLPFRRTLKRTPLFGVGCAGGAVALSRAFEYLRGHPEETVAVLSVELCSLTFLPRDGTMTQLVAAALFGDGAACAVLCGERAMGLPDGAAGLSRAFLKRHGNLSSASVLFILKDALARPARPGSWGLLAALGPGFALEALLLRES